MISYQTPPAPPRAGPPPASSAISPRLPQVHNSILRPADTQMVRATETGKTKRIPSKSRTALASDASPHGITCVPQAKLKLIFPTFQHFSVYPEMNRFQNPGRAAYGCSAAWRNSLRSEEH